MKYISLNKKRGVLIITAPIVREGYLYIFILLIITLLLGITMNPYWSIIPGVLTLFVTFFFRNPKRIVPNDSTLILSPADGKIVGIEEIFEDQFLNSAAIKVTIFLSVFDVHVNRSPAEGKITLQQYTCGHFKPAYKKSAPFQNERHTIGLEVGTVKILVTQIAGIIARRIVSWVALGDQLEQGQRYGMIKFGSCTEIIVPIHVDILVTAGEHVKGGKTIIGKIC